MSVPVRLIQPMLGRKRLQWLFEGCLELAVRGMNLDSPSDAFVNGERALLQRLVYANRDLEKRWTLVDAGANVGEWSATASEVLERAEIDHVIWAFEPGREPYAQLVERTAELPAIRPQRVALGSEQGEAVLRYDRPGSGLASLYARRGVALDREERIEITTLDAFRERHGIGDIDFLKLDVEGHELAVLRGAADTLAEGQVSAVQFEFGGTHIDSRTFFRDLYDALGSEFEISRILRDGLRPLGAWSERLEIFRLGNYVAQRHSSPRRPTP
jgi:FkbM family methyltransferase